MGETPATRRGPLGWLRRLTHLGVDPSRPRHETKHVVLTNEYTLFTLCVLVLAVAGSQVNHLLPEVVAWLAAGGAVALGALALNAAGFHTLAATTVLVDQLVIFTRVGTLEPAETEHDGLFFCVAVASFVMLPRSRWWIAALLTAASAILLLGMTEHLRTTPTPEPLPGFDTAAIGLSNTISTLAVLVFFAARTASETWRVERELIEERRKTEAILKREVAHQVAERSREIGAALVRADGPITPADLASRFGDRYRVLRPLGEGGMGAVFEVERLTDKQRLALKVMTGQVSREQAARFAREAEIGARVHDPHLVPIVDVGVAPGGAPYLVMELALGGSLERERARFGDPRWALPILRDVALGLAALHAAGVVHRDLKPANVLLDERGAAKVSDYGIARLGVLSGSSVDPDAATAAAPRMGSADLTGTGAWVGTPLYMAPEAARGGRDVGAAADLFALGIVAHELLTGRSPFATAPALLALADQPIPEIGPLTIHGVPAAVSEVIRVCLAADPSARPTIERVVAALR